MTNDTMTNKKKYILKPGKHQFAPGSSAAHHNDNITDAEAEWYIEMYPHIKDLFEINLIEPPEKKSVESTNQSNPNEDLSTTN
jgi:hypothetical protein